MKKSLQLYLEGISVIPITIFLSFTPLFHTVYYDIIIIIFAIFGISLCLLANKQENKEKCLR